MRKNKVDKEKLNKATVSSSNITCVGFFLCSAIKKGSTSDALVIMISPSCSHVLSM
jgi:hypothetical protein